MYPDLRPADEILEAIAHLPEDGLSEGDKTILYDAVTAWVLREGEPDKSRDPIEEALAEHRDRLTEEGNLIDAAVCEHVAKVMKVVLRPPIFVSTDVDKIPDDEVFFFEEEDDLQ